MTEPRLFVIYNRDAPGMADTREQHRPAHIAFMKSLGVAAKAGGPILGADGETRLGGMFILEAASLEEAQAVAARDPFKMAGLFETSFVDEWRWQTRNP
ncbi:MAG: hypothetical protein CFE33_18540 [Pseudorhodobacter sp. PARRP1]|nr:MAG: hypothetical protein CFE33_18540 [Pseudorhodobacter sp. PARRP1]